MYRTRPLLGLLTLLLVAALTPQGVLARQTAPARSAAAPVANPDAYTVAEDAALNQNAAGGVLANDTDADGDLLRAQLFSGAAHGTLTLNPDGSFTYTPAPNFNGTDSFDYTALAIAVEDLAGQSLAVRQDKSAIQVSVGASIQLGSRSFNLPTQTATSALAGTITADVDMQDSGAFQPQQIRLTDAQLTAVDGASVSFSVPIVGGVEVTIPANSLVLLLAQAGAAANVGAGGGFSQTGNTFEATGSVTVKGSGQFADLSETFDLSTFDPQPYNIAGQIQRADALLGLVIPLSYTYSTTVTQGSITATLSITVSTSQIHAEHLFATESSAPATATIDVTPVNDPPVAVNDEATTVEATEVLIDVLANDTDLDGDALSIGGIADPPHGTAAVVDGQLGYTPDAGFTGTDTFTYTVSDGQGGTAQGQVTVEVLEGNDAPVAEDDAYTTAAGQALTVGADEGVLANDSDEDGDPLTAVLVEDVEHGTLTLNPDGSFTYTPEAGFTGEDSFTYQAEDGQATGAAGKASGPTVLSNEATVTLTVQEATADFQVSMIVREGDASLLPYESLWQETSAEKIAAGATFSYVFRVRNNSPQIMSSTQRIGVPNAMKYSTLCSTDSDDLYCSGLFLPGLYYDYYVTAKAPAEAGVTVETTAEVTQVTPTDLISDNNTATVSFVTVPDEDQDGASDEQEDEVGDGNDDGTQDSQQKEVVSIPLLRAYVTVECTLSVFGICLVWSSRNNLYFSYSAASKHLATPTPRWIPMSVGARLESGSGGAAGKQSRPEDVPDVTFTIILPEDSTANSYWLYGPTPDDTTDHWFEFLYDGETGAEFDVWPDGRPVVHLHFIDGKRGDRDLEENGEIAALGLPAFIEGNASPTTTDDVAETDEDTALDLDVLANDSDPDGVNLALSTVGAPAHGTAEKLDGTMVRYTPAADFNGTDSFTYTVTDGRGGTAQGTVTITVNGINDAPAAAEITSPGEGATVLIAGAPETAFTVTWNEADDVEGDALAYTWQLAAEPTFADPLLAVETGELTRFETDYGTVGVLLTERGVETGASAELYHRVVASDGQAETASAAMRVTLTRGVLTDTETTGLPETYVLEQSYPNPFNPSTTIRFALPEAGVVRLVVYDLVGHEVATLVSGSLPAGYHEARWDATGFASGLYLYRLEAAGHIQTMKMTLLK